MGYFLKLNDHVHIDALIDYIHSPEPPVEKHPDAPEARVDRLSHELNEKLNELIPTSAQATEIENLIGEYLYQVESAIFEVGLRSGARIAAELLVDNRK